MTISFENPYAIKIRDKCIEEDKIPSTDKEAISKIRAEIEDLRKKSHDYCMTKVEELGKKLEETKQGKVELSSMPNETPLEKKALLQKVNNLYKDSVELYLTFREIRKQLKGGEE